MNSALYSYRQFRNWQESDVSKELAISVQEYKELESGIQKVDVETALKLSELYLAPPHLFLSKSNSNDFSIIYSYCKFENSNGYVNNLYKDSEVVLEVKDEIIQLLKEEIEQLRKQNTKILGFLEKGECSE
jgi:transcriptional regulator with XRE-family HTH domain